MSPFEIVPGYKHRAPIDLNPMLATHTPFEFALAFTSIYIPCMKRSKRGLPLIMRDMSDRLILVVFSESFRRVISLWFNFNLSDSNLESLRSYMLIVLDLIKY